MSDSDLEILKNLIPVKVWGERLDKIDDIKHYKGKFVVTDDGKFFAKLFPIEEWNSIEFFHDMVVGELGVNNARSLDIMEVIVGGGKMEVELVGDYVECRLYGKSTIYGNYDSNSINAELLEAEVKNVFGIDKKPVQIISNSESSI